ncbi:hypothetical protein A3G56_01735 [Candidatus Falkowbacteria bacterium RIFCSPLOWO2_12_FULL_45_10]|uniref:Glycosyltransferase 2-like domain-containing protein n=3 Tax=Candidatus Falkowiibacteriota TaxID=1752728 RepID=A0A1F5RXM2_9BACT|nr:MAG: hypothetical protein A3G56_01735 [Candidatus Falkowbacteria bacterium RIFCSPLOWO2_12_FULL_45_10]OGF19072.1 MAG: hypothetical protein A3D54_02965 [Candidatus Falkowbacteria bacterium RIFCSPHIGHO2_02_FULL_45_15]OGF19256.1 MAG: hypothetical protein A3I35_00145 [Candidatus Falkowbacteria bacterium RIFCSPLOWO2_02_FULL_45_15]
MFKNKLISIIIPVYNQAEEIQATLASVLSQTYKKHEVIIVNDGSTDSTAVALENLKRKFWDKKIRCKIIQQNNQGANAARNRGAAEARGEYIIFWDADIVAAPAMLEKIHKPLQDNPNVSYAYSSFVYGSPPHLLNNIPFILKAPYLNRCGGKKFKLWPFDADKLKQMPYIHTTSLIRREHAGRWDAEIKRLQDWDLWLTLLKQGHIGVWVPEYLFTVNTQHGTMSHWLPRWAYKFMPWLKEVKKYKEAVEVIKRKHELNF